LTRQASNRLTFIAILPDLYQTISSAFFESDKDVNALPMQAENIFIGTAPEWADFDVFGPILAFL
jgi:hypothetical protein